MSKFNEYLEAVRSVVNEDYDYNEAVMINKTINSLSELNKFLNSLSIADLKKGVKVTEGGMYVNKRLVGDTQNISKLVGDIRSWFSHNGDRKGFNYPTIKQSKGVVKITSFEKTSDLKLSYKDSLKKIKSLGGRLPTLSEIQKIKAKGMFYVSDKTKDSNKVMTWDANEKNARELPGSNYLKVAYIDKEGKLKTI